MKQKKCPYNSPKEELHLSAQDGIYDVNIYGRYGEVVAEFEFAVGTLPEPEDPEYELTRQILETVELLLPD